MKRFLLVGITLALLAPLRSEPIEADLGEGLHYHRSHALPAELPPPSREPAPLVLDLRYASADAAAATALDGWIKFRVSADTPLIVLINSATSPVLHGVFTANRTQSGFVTLGSADAGYSPDVVVTMTPEAERRAYDVLEHNGSVAALLVENVDKRRTDEASMMRERAELIEAADLAEADELALPNVANEARPSASPPPPLDAVLQRAVHLHRTLLALKRIR